jgi:hypothetical protein
VKKRRGEEIRIAGWIPVSAVSHIACGNRRERGILEVSATQAVKHRSEARDHRGEDDTARSAHAARLAQGFQAIVSLGQMVERSEEKHGVGTRVRQWNRACVAHLGADER